jgi:hypothetical protein
VFLRYISITIFLHLTVVAVTVVEAVYVPFWTLYLRAILLPRIFLLLWLIFCGMCCAAINVGHLYRPGRVVKYARTFRAVPALGLWLLLGYVDLYVVRYPSIIIDVTAPLWVDTGQKVEASLLRAAIDVAVVCEFYLARNVIYEQGVRRNVVFNLLRKNTGGVEMV